MDFTYSEFLQLAFGIAILGIIVYFYYKVTEQFCPTCKNALDKRKYRYQCKNCGIDDVEIGSK